MARTESHVMSWLAGFALIFASCTLSPSAVLAQGGEPLKIPMMESFSGAAAEFGGDMYTGAVVAAEMINKSGGVKGRPLEFYKADAPYDDVPTAVTMFRKLARDPKVPIIFDGGATTVIVAVHDLAGTFQVPLYAFSSGGQWRLPSFNAWVFRSLPMPERAIPLIIPKAKAKFNIKKAAVVYAHDDEIGVANRVVLRKAAQEAGIEVIEQSVKSHETDFSAQLTKIKSENVDAFFLALQPFEGGTMMLQAREMGLNQPVIGDIGTSNVDYWKLAKGRVGTTITYSPFNPQDPRPIVQNFIKAYKDKYGKEPTAWAALTGDAAFTLAHVINQANDLTRDEIRKSFASTKDLETMGGVIGWEGSGDALRKQIIIVTWKDGQLVPVPESFWK
jgi:branched-chain amino acid transport system substrate-binding protein